MKKSKRNSRTIIDRAKTEVNGFRAMYAKLEQKVHLGGLSASTLNNYGRCIAKISLHFNCPAHELEEEQINGFLHHLLTTDQPSRSYFKHTIYGLRFLFRVHARAYRALKLPSLKKRSALPVVLSHKECIRLYKSGRILFTHQSPITQKWTEFWQTCNLVVNRCPVCKQGNLMAIAEIPPQRGPPASITSDPPPNPSFKGLV